MSRKSVILFVTLLAAIAMAQSSPQSKTSKPGTAAKPAPAKPTAIIHTTVGDMTCTLFPDKAPIGVANFIGLANGTRDWKNPVSGATKHGVPLYDGTIFHRVIPEFMIQGGDPLGNGMGGPRGPGFPFKDECSPNLKFDVPGRLAMANAGPGTNGSQFFITEVPTPHLHMRHTIFGQCENVDLVKAIARVPTKGSDMPAKPVVIERVIVERVGPAPADAPEL
jgi:peptidyl-prolyl cis-trans isomerase A (cyclophilin A)